DGIRDLTVTGVQTCALPISGYGAFGGPAVHSESVVLNKAGTAFENVTLDNGTVKSVSGDQLTITESANNVTYKDVTITVPSNARSEERRVGKECRALGAERR